MVRTTLCAVCEAVYAVTVSVITHIVNSSIIYQFVPDSWKLAIVHPVQKSPISTHVSNFRPIPILPMIAKITEHIVYEQLFHYFSSHGLFLSSQHGFKDEPLD